MSCGVGHRGGLDPKLLWLCHRLATTVLIGTLAWEHPYAMGAALKRQKRKKDQKPKPKPTKQKSLFGKKKKEKKIWRKKASTQKKATISVITLLRLPLIFLVIYTNVKKYHIVHIRFALILSSTDILALFVC